MTCCHLAAKRAELSVERKGLDRLATVIALLEVFVPVRLDEQVKIATDIF
jgi:hypothetical protein